ncbi:exodeoxyribonuclease V subunit beta [Photobacterium sp. GB-36]|uniref:exodeoxyribonuclease V subunit beta n=1 Tax=Photobacterium sp. GB-36 TaxID=2022108 RepID=UPI000D162E7C|nr:exodeoxyribonuclease V subunit beta [Photobacterium sp. GB-36]PSV42692.1 exodeoxyribonuclease V subunit beta [Photobacterium sp. GB-36]
MTVQTQTNILQPMAFPLHGTRLIEASAGTGKTFTIASLYLRLLLGHGNAETRHAVELTVDQILVVTFTEAATAELRDRIRGRIHDARLAFSRGVSGDPVIAPLLQEYPDHKAAANILLQAERQMDEAAIYTIHGFCQRMLTQNAFESGCRFNNEFVTDESQLKNLVVADYWRSHFYQLPRALACQIRDLWSSPHALLKDIGNSLTGVPVKLSVAAMTASLEQLHQQNIERINEFKALWKQHFADLEALIANSDVNKRSYTKKSLPTWLAQVNEWANQPTENYDLPDKLEKFHQQELITKTPKGEAPQHAVFVAVADLLDNPATLRDPLLAHAIEHCRILLAQAKAHKGWLSFDDLLTQLGAAIDNDQDDLLASKIRSQYPVAMIDEFQDTDPLQYGIFSSVYHDHPECGLFMIGDPKQAIYAFRGADIFTYIQARRQVQDHYTLGTNWRSTADMIASVNSVFDTPNSPFIYDQDITFDPVGHSPKAPDRSWWLNGEQQHALTFWLQDSLDGKPITKGDYESTMATATAAHIQHILEQSQQGQGYFLDKETQHPVKAGDIAVLVRTGREGKLVREALAKQGIASVYLSNRDSVFSTAEAADVQRLLQAVLTPDDDRALRAALASGLFSLTAIELDTLNNDENEWEIAVNSFKQYRQQWLKRGVMPMLRSVMAKNNIAERLLVEEGGERRLTDLLHIGELLQEASQTLDSDYALLRWLAENVAEPNGNSDEQILRLESERNLVQIVTIHKSKGLEYDLVFMPFVCSYREVDSKGEVKYHDEDDNVTILDITKHADSISKADKERLAEDLRLIYVALTRAVYGCFVGMAPVRNGRSSKEPTGLHKSAMGYLIQNGEECGVAALELALAKLSEAQPTITIAEPPVLPVDKWAGQNEQTEALNRREFERQIERNWWMTSYSNLVKQGHQAHHDSSLDLPGFDIDSVQKETPENSETEVELEPEYSIYTFPRGARPGTFLHTVFEEIEFTRPVDSPETVAKLTELLQLEHYELAWLPVLQQLINDVLHCPLDGEQLRLAEKTPQQRLTEMEFLLPIEMLQSPLLNKVIAKHDSISAKAGELGFSTVSGMLKGFIDLVFEHQGKYYVLDWKSNYLGDDPQVYRGEQLVEAMRDHRYDLQYQIYALALQRFLRSRIPNYDYETHFGGVYYLFLRGIQAGSDSGIFHAKPSQALLEELDLLIDGALPHA